MILPNVRDAFSLSAIQRASVAMTSDSRTEDVNRRVVFMDLTLQAIFSTREAALDLSGHSHHPFWTRSDVSAGILTTASAILLERI